MQVGDVPVFVGDGAGDLACRCGGSILVRGNRPGMLLAIDIECAACGAVTTTPGLNADQVVPFGVRMVARDRLPTPQPFTLPPGMVLGDRDELLRVDRLSAPRDVPADPFDMSEATLAAAAIDYDRLSGGHLAAHRSAVPPDTNDAVPGLAQLPLAWALRQLQPGVTTKGWRCLAQEPDTIAAVQLGAFREFPQVWSHHPMFPAMAAGAATTGFSTHALAVFAAARFMVKDGNRIVFTSPDSDGRIGGFHIEISPTERVPVHVRRFDRFDWPRSLGATPATTRAAAIDALISEQSRINTRQPGFLVLSVGAVHRQADPALMEGLEQTLRERGRRHRGLAGVALVLPKIHGTGRPDQVKFGWIYLPYANPHFAHAKVGIGMSRDDVIQASSIG